MSREDRQDQESTVIKELAREVLKESGKTSYIPHSWFERERADYYFLVFTKDDLEFRPKTKILWGTTATEEGRSSLKQLIRLFVDEELP